MSPVITIENLAKRYRIRHQFQHPRYYTLRDVLTERFKRLFQIRKSEIKIQNSTEDFWALKEVSFELHQGEVLGIIGRNGAGKSTLLKILSRITEPTEGRVRLRGRVASLLEVGTGFHPELTGRENIFLNGAILGMSRAEIKRKFDEIVAFAEVEKFLDTPVKHYSSGMYVRLAFAVAAHLEPEILIVDEVLAVGDAEFQRKCLGKMEQVSRCGRTVLFVTHNMGALEALCTKAVLLDGGRLAVNGNITEALTHYTRAIRSRNEKLVQGGPMAECIQLKDVEATSTDTPMTNVFQRTAEIVVRARYVTQAHLPRFLPLLGVESRGVRLFTLAGQERRGLQDHSEFVEHLTIPGRLLRPGIYTLAGGGIARDQSEWLWAESILAFEIVGAFEDEADRARDGFFDIQRAAFRHCKSGSPCPQSHSS
jgi:lipopolysaccharide transport system ATP-binding protein